MESNDSAVVKVRFFGDFSVTKGEAHLTPKRQSKARTLLQYMLFNPGQALTTHQLSEVLWPQFSPEPGSSSLRVAIHAVRKAIKDELQIDHVPGGYVLRGAPIESDLSRFEAASTRAERCGLAGDQTGHLAACRAVADAYSAELLATEDGQWIDQARYWYRSKAKEALSRLRDHAAVKADLAGALHWSWRLLELDRGDEQTYRVLMALHAQRGERGQVRHWFEICRSELAEMGVKPSPETLAVHSRGLGRRSSVPNVETAKQEALLT